MRPPNKKKFDEDMDSLTSQIKEKEAELDNVRQAVVEVKRLKALRTECFNKRRQIVTDLDRINKEIPDRMKRLNEIEASLYYKNEDKINSAIQRLEWNLSVKTYKLTEEKKIVSEIDSLKRSKKNLVQYVTLKQEISEIRDRQKALRDGRDTFTKEFNRLRAQEEAVRSKNRSLATIKREIDGLYETRRQTNANFKQQRGEFNEAKEKRRKEDGDDDWVGVASSDSPNSDSTLEGGDSGDGGPVAAWPSTTVMDSNSNTNLSTLPKGDKSSTEKWVESSMAFAQRELSAPEDGPTPSPRLSPL